MIQKNKILAVLLTIASTFYINVYADNKSDLLSEITTLETNLTTLKTNSIKDLEAKALALSKSFDDALSSLGYDSKTIDYLVSLGKITSNFKTDLTTEVNALSKEISDKSLTELNSLSAIKNNIILNYTTVSDNEKAILSSSINAISLNYNNLSDSFSGKIITLNNKYTTNLNNYKETLKNVYNTNSTIINSLNNFATKYDALYTLYNEFQKNYTSFKDTYLAFAGELTAFSESKQAYYVDVLRKELEKIRDVNIEANKSLENYKVDVDRLIDILIENFKNSLKNKIDNSYGVIYSDTDINSIVSRFNTVKNRYYDLDGKLKASEVISNTGSIEEINFISDKLNTINSKIISLIGTGSNVNTFENLKIRLENEMVKYYNSNYQSYRQDLLLKLKEKLNIVALEAKNTILASDTIDLRYSLLNDKISKSNDMDYINTQIAEFKKDITKYGYLNSDILNKKLASLNYNLGIFAVKKELSLFKYNKMDKTKYDAQLLVIFNKLKSKYPEKYTEKLNTVLNKIDKLLLTKLSDKTRFMLLSVKLNILNYINNN